MMLHDLGPTDVAFLIRASKLAQRDWEERIRNAHPHNLSGKMVKRLRARQPICKTANSRRIFIYFSASQN